jgi:hypothetical protein
MSATDSGTWTPIPIVGRRLAYTRSTGRDLPATQGAVIVEVDEHELDADEAEFEGERLAIIVLDTVHMYGLSFVPRPPGALLH